MVRFFETRLFKNFSWIAVEKLNRILFGFLLWAILARILSLDELGHYSIAMAFISIMYCLTNPGISGIVTRDLVNYPSKAEKIMASAYLIQLVGAFLAMIISLASMPYFAFDPKVKTYVAILCLTFFFRFFEISRSIFEATQDLKKYAQFELISFLIFLVLKVLVAYLFRSVEYILMVTVLEGVVVSFYSLLLLKSKNLDFRKMIPSFSRIAQILLEGMPLLFGMATSLLNMRMDQLMVGRLVGAESAAIYAAATKISEAWLVLPSVCAPLIYPILIRLFDTDKNAFKKVASRIIIVSSVFAVIFAGLISWSSSYLIKWIYGDHLETASQVLKILIWSGVPYISFFVVTQIIQIRKITKIVLFSSLLTLLMNLWLNNALIPIFGISGAAIATVASAVSGVGVSTLYTLLKR